MKKLVRKQTLIEAKDKGYLPIMRSGLIQQERFYCDARGEPTNESYMHTTNRVTEEPTTQDDLRNWLRVTYGIHISMKTDVTIGTDKPITYSPTITNGSNKNSFEPLWNLQYVDYEFGLEEAIIEGLKLI